MGRPKATLPLDDQETFITRIVKTFQAAGIEDVVVVLGHGAPAIEARLQRLTLPPRIVMEAFEQRPDLRARLVHALTGGPVSLLRRAPPADLQSCSRAYVTSFREG